MEEEKMKRAGFFAMVMFGVFSMAVFAGGSKEATSPSNAPRTIDPADFIRNISMNAPEDVLVGIAYAKESSTSASKTSAVNRAKEEIGRQIVSIVQMMVTDYTASSEVEPSPSISLQESVSRTISSLSGINIVDEGIDADGNYWVAVYMNKADVGNVISQAVETAKQQ
jgi:hypothetical protein